MTSECDVSGQTGLARYDVTPIAAVLGRGDGGCTSSRPGRNQSTRQVRGFSKDFTTGVGTDLV